MNAKIVISFVALSMGTMPLTTFGQFKANYEEAKIEPYVLPPILKFRNGEPVENSADWERRRIEILDLFSNHVYGRMPNMVGVNLDWQINKEFVINCSGNEKSDGCNARCQELTMRIIRGNKSFSIPLLFFLPLEKDGAVKRKKIPVFVAYNFEGNHSIHRSKEISLGAVWKPDLADPTKHAARVATDNQRGKKAARWPIDDIVSAGFGLVTLYYGDVDPDFDDGYSNGIHNLFPEMQNRSNNWSSIGAWAWSLHRVMDVLCQLPNIDRERVAILGHSRLGKTALWAGATDERFSLVISNNSGCGGAALSRRRIGETVARINHVFPHWFCQQHDVYNDREAYLPVDQHMLLAAIAPRALYVASAARDKWADPKGEFLATCYASRTWRLFGNRVFESEEIPKVGQPVLSDRVGYHLRSGGHGIKRYDWQQFLRFAKQCW